MIDTLTIFQLTITIVLCIVTCLNYKVNAKKLHLEIYEKRFNVYVTILKYYNEVTSSNGASQETILDFLLKKEEAYFLFCDNKSIYKKLNDIHDLSSVIDLNYCSLHTADGTNESKISYGKRRREALKHFNTLINELKTDMTPFLNFKNVRTFD